MTNLEVAIRVVEIIIGIIAAALIGDLLGNRIGRVRLATVCGGIVLVTIAGFAIFAGIELA